MYAYVCYCSGVGVYIKKGGGGGGFWNEKQLQWTEHGGGQTFKTDKQKKKITTKKKRTKKAIWRLRLNLLVYLTFSAFVLKIQLFLNSSGESTALKKERNWPSCDECVVITMSKRQCLFLSYRSHQSKNTKFPYIWYIIDTVVAV